MSEADVITEELYAVAQKAAATASARDERLIDARRLRAEAECKRAEAERLELEVEREQAARNDPSQPHCKHCGRERTRIPYGYTFFECDCLASIRS